MEVAPGGPPLDPLSPKTINLKKGDDRIFQDSGTIRDTMAHKITSDELYFGTNEQFPETHQFLRQADVIVALPFLGLSTGQRNDEDEILAILQSHLLEPL